MKKLLGILFAIFVGGAVAVTAMPVNTYAACDSANNTPLGLRPWYYGLTDDSCNIKAPGKSDEELRSFIWRIVLNVMTDAFVIVGYVALGFVIFGGYKYLMSGGDPGKVKSGKTILTNGIIGFIIVLLATVISNTMIDVIVGAAGSDQTSLNVASILNWLYAFSGMVAVAYIIFGGVNYAMAQGDPGKIKLASQTITYAVIGLAVILLASAITNFVAGSLGSSGAIVNMLDLKGVL